MLYTKLSTEAGTLNQFTLSSYLYALHFYRQWQQEYDISPKHLDFCGVLQLATNAKEQRLVPLLQQAFANYPELVQCVNRYQASELAGIDIQLPGLFFPQAGWVSPVHLCQSLCSHPNIEIINHQAVIVLEQQNQQWQLLGNDKTILEADSVVIANSHDALQFEQSQSIPAKTIRGQITLLESSSLSAQLKTVICHQGYITPAIDNMHNLGATFDNGHTNTAIRRQDHQRNLDSLQQSVPSLLPKHKTIAANSFRAGGVYARPALTICRLLVHCIISNNFCKTTPYCAKNAHSDIITPGSYYPNLYINIAHGSRGLTSTPLSGELIAAMICAEPLPLPRHLVSALNPARFVIRDLIRNKV